MLVKFLRRWWLSTLITDTDNDQISDKFSGSGEIEPTTLGAQVRCSISLPGDFRPWESPQTLPALFIGPFEHVERFPNLKFTVKRITNIQSTVLSSSEGTAAIHLGLNNV